MSKVKSILSVVIFAGLIFSFSAICQTKGDAMYSEAERRELAKAPELSMATLSNGDFMDEFETYTADQFPGRDGFRSVKSAFNMFVLGRVDNNNLYYKNGHISKLDAAEDDAMKDYAANKFKEIYDSSIAGTNAKVYLSIVPDKNFILAEPNGYPSFKYDEFADKMKSRVPYMQYIDIKPLLTIDDYYRTDSHWKQENITDIAEKLGSAMGTDVKTEYTVNTLDIPFEGVYYKQLGLPFEPDTIKYLTNAELDNAKVEYTDANGMPKEGKIYNMDKANGKDPYEMFLGGVTPLVTIENPGAKSDKELVIIRDSYGSSLAPLMSAGYKKVTVADIRYLPGKYLTAFGVNFANSDVLFIYSTTLINASSALQ